MRRMRRRVMGTFTWLKKGGPTVTFTPVATSETMGNMVPQNTAKVIATRMTLLSKKLASREKKLSISCSLLREGSRQIINPNETARASTR